MMLRQFLINKLIYYCFLVLIFLLPVNAFSLVKDKIKGPIIITSESLTAENSSNMATFEGSVIARTSDMTIYADRMVVQYNKESGNVKQINAYGSVKLVKEDRIITSKEATYFADEEKVIFIGEPRAVQKENVVTGKKMTYFMNEDRFIVEDSKVFITKGKE